MLRSELSKVKLEKRLNTLDRSNWTKHFLSLLSLSKIPLIFRYCESERTEKRKKEKRDGLVYVREYALLGNVFDGWDDICWFHGWECATWSVVPAKEDALTRAASRKERMVALSYARCGVRGCYFRLLGWSFKFNGMASFFLIVFVAVSEVWGQLCWSNTLLFGLCLDWWRVVERNGMEWNGMEWDGVTFHCLVL